MSALVLIWRCGADEADTEAAADVVLFEMAHGEQQSTFQKWDSRSHMPCAAVDWSEVDLRVGGGQLPLMAYDVMAFDRALGQRDATDFFLRDPVQDMSGLHAVHRQGVWQTIGALLGPQTSGSFQ